jgi:hypothetical protein
MILGMVTKPPFSIIVRPESRTTASSRASPCITRYSSSTDMLLRLSLEKWGFKPEVDVPILQMGGCRRSWPEWSRGKSSAGRCLYRR